MLDALEPYRTAALAVAAGLALAAAGAAGWAANGWRLGQALAEQRAEVATERQAAADARTAANLAARAWEADTQARIAAIDQSGYQELSQHEQANADLRAARSAGAVRLRVAAVCPPIPTAGVPGTADRAGLGDGAGAGPAAAAGQADNPGAVLAPEAEPAYDALRASLGRHAVKLAACQRIIAEMGRGYAPVQTSAAVD
ncbi:hypothetical protein GPA19_07915 [Azoarcus indigens]|uniref:lysis system i-spanin subunit Rz n=1 Tax=Azoarcus indigens TaxID=29545 RepID=UPI0013C29FAE|nr:lysis system i-spanin subunit Rz [Azoarcus indigens]NMG64869.1 hypothetical protein [Azoarcus indigens]